MRRSGVRFPSRARTARPVQRRSTCHAAVVAEPLYDDGRIALDGEGVIIRWYYPWGTKKIRYGAIRSITTHPLKEWHRRWRLWGSGDFVHWFNLDGNRPKKRTAIELDVGGQVRPTITPDDPETVARSIEERIAH